MKIAFFETDFEEEVAIKDRLKGIKAEFFFTQERIEKKHLRSIKDCDILSVFIYSELDSEILSELKNLKIIATRSTGFDHIDMNYCKKKNILVCNVPNYGENTVAEHTFALLLTVSRRLKQSYEKAKIGDLNLDGLMGWDLKNKIIGIIGFGNIGKHVARIAKGFEMKVLVYDIKKNKKLQKRFGFKYTSFYKLLGNSDVITIHVPLVKETHHLINKKTIIKIKKGAVLINTSRGAVVETDAIIKGLKENIFSSVCLDVLEEEPLIKEEYQLLSKKFSNKELANVIKNHLLLKLDNVVISPHCAFYSREAIERIRDVTASNILGFIKNKIKNKVKYGNNN